MDLVEQKIKLAYFYDCFNNQRKLVEFIIFVEQIMF